MGWRKEPLWGFGAIALLLFGVDAWTDALDPDPSEIVITESQVSALRDRFVTQHDRAPTAQELEDRVWRLVDEEILFREGVALGMADGDPIVRRRVLQKMGFVEEAIATPDEPTDRELEGLLAANPGRYEVAARVAFEHVFFAREDPQASEQARRARAALAAGAEATDFGGAFLHGRSFSERAVSEVSDDFGADFAARIQGLPVGSWEVAQSTYGWHVVRLTRAVAAQPATLEDARAALLRDWKDARLVDAKRRMRDARRDRYAVRIEGS